MSTPIMSTTSLSSLFSFRISSLSSTAQTCRKRECAEAKGKEGVVSCCLDCFLGEDNLCLFAYGVPSWFSASSNIGAQHTCSMDDEDPPETVLRRANEMLACNGFGSYDIVKNNCFDFAFYCKTGSNNLNRTVLGVVTAPIIAVAEPIAEAFSCVIS
uniref:LRAT domain-containing protein n=1 Tax=Oryza glaberrima TaxID=4538 RepID=I1R1P1_ORYGL